MSYFHTIKSLLNFPQQRRNLTCSHVKLRRCLATLPKNTTAFCLEIWYKMKIFLLFYSIQRLRKTFVMIVHKAQINKSSSKWKKLSLQIIGKLRVEPRFLYFIKNWALADSNVCNTAKAVPVCTHCVPGLKHQSGESQIYALNPMLHKEN